MEYAPKALLLVPEFPSDSFGRAFGSSIKGLHYEHVMNAVVGGGPEESRTRGTRCGTSR